MTTKYLTGMLAKNDRSNLEERTTREHLFQLAYGALQWPWLLKSLYGGTQAEKIRLFSSKY